MAKLTVFESLTSGAKKNKNSLRESNFYKMKNEKRRIVEISNEQSPKA